MSYFKHHVFFCCNPCAPGETCCQNHDATGMMAYTRECINSLGLKGKGNIRINKTGCLGRCDEGPVLVVYPDNVWYTFAGKEDIDEIINEHLVHGRPVSRLQLADH